MSLFFKIVVFIDLIAILIFFTKPLYLLNIEVAFISSLLIVLGSFLGYKRVVEQGSDLKNHQDYIDKIEDRFDLYSKEESVDDAKELFEQEKQRVKSQSNIKVFIKSYRGFFSPLRLLGYLFMTVSILMLIKRDIFEPIYYLLGLAIVPISALVFSFFSKKI